MEPFDFGTAAMYSCATGFFLEGDRMRSCGGSEASNVGTWDGIDPVCTGEIFKIFKAYPGSRFMCYFI